MDKDVVSTALVSTSSTTATTARRLYLRFNLLFSSSFLIPFFLNIEPQNKACPEFIEGNVEF